jgi:hypothetical protein
MFDNEAMINPLAWTSVLSSVDDRVPDHVGRQRDRKSVSRIDGAISGDGGLRIKIVVLQRIILARRVTHRYGSCGPRPRDVCAKQRVANVGSRFTAAYSPG